ncbi:neuraminidase-like domain-containing protein [Lutibaculum baratangense]|uniref:Uncharacterized protein n=1 Tax=Lutibaculum baratangense AMV1 TaxID=631454 RepID=V4RC79_9HYPH|nr:neuraminidase-like domain-containing protein [Lutibaculum baratangense]ESR22984.1 hypothetical protein N177_3052 [Lutibaculum baratangense AMV1]
MTVPKVLDRLTRLSPRAWRTAAHRAGGTNSSLQKESSDGTPPLLALAALPLGAAGPAVSNLHALLDRLGFDRIDAEERDEARYGPTTRRMVESLAHEFGIEQARPGELDAESAEAINRVAFDREIFALVEGRVVDTSGEAAADVPVTIGDADNDLRCAEAATGPDGGYRAFYDPAFYRRERPGVGRPKDLPDLVATAAWRDRPGTARSDPVRATEREIRIDLTLPAEARRPAGPRVRGTVFDAEGRRFPGVRVEAFDRDIGPGRTSLGSDDTDEEGAFEIPYDPADAADGEGLIDGRTTVDLLFGLSRDGVLIDALDIVRLPVDDDATITAELPAGEDDLALGIVARSDEFVRIRATTALVPRGPSEFERLLAALEPLTRTVALADFDEAKTRDVSFAAREIGAPRALVADLAAAFRSARDDLPGTEPALLYALARESGALAPHAIAARRLDDLVAAVRRADERNLIPPVGGELEAAVAAVRSAAVAKAMSLPTGEGAGSLDDVLRSTLPDAQARAALVTALRDGGDAGWSRFAAEHAEVDIPSVRYAIELGTLTRNDLGLADALKAKAPNATSLRTLALDLEPQTISEAVETLGALPLDRTEDEDEPAARDRLTAELVGLIETLHPTAVVARAARGLAAAAPSAVDPATAALLDRAVRHTAFELGRDPVAATVERHADVLFEGVNDPEARERAAAGLKRIQRLYQISPDPDTLSAVLRATGPGGHTFQGAFDISRLGERSFLSRFPTATAGEAQALSTMHSKARAQAETVAALLVNEYQEAREVRPAALGAPDEIASFADFFGGAEMCECEECRSVVGPAAYLVDLFEFLDKRCAANEDGLTPLDVLIGNPSKSWQGHPVTGLRPDLAHIKLTCENTNTTIPTIDLINEILESVVAFGQVTPLATDDAGEPLAPPVLAPNEPSPGVTGAELSAAPEHVVARAYEILGDAVYPISLPYDRLVASARAITKEAGVDRAALIRVFGAGDEEARALAAATERLGLLPKDVEILTDETLTAAPEGAGALLGRAAAGWTDEMSSVRRLLEALDVSFGELVALMRTDFVGGEVPSGSPDDPMARLFLTVEQLATLRADFDAEPPPQIAEALERGGLAIADVRAIVEASADRLATTWVLDPPISCDLDHLFVRHLDASPVAAGEFLAVHRFVRLAKRMRVSFEVLDTLLAATPADEPRSFRPDRLVRLAGLRALGAELSLEPAVAASLVADIGEALWRKLFVASGVARLDPSLAAADGDPGQAGASIGPVIPSLAAVLQVNAGKLAALAKSLRVETLDRPAISALHRTVVLARALGMSPEDLVAFCTILGEDCLTKPRDAASLSAALARVRALGSSGLGPAEIRVVIGEDPPSLQADRIVKALGDALQPLARGAPGDGEGAEGDPAVPPEEAARAEAARLVLASIFGIDPDLVRLALGDGTEEPLFRLAGRSAIELFLDLARKPDQAQADALLPEATAVLSGLARLAQLAKTAGLDVPTLRLLAGPARVAPAAVLASLAGEPDRAALVAMIARLGAFKSMLADAKDAALAREALAALAAADGDVGSAAFLSALAGALGVDPLLAADAVAGGSAALARAAAREDPVAAFRAAAEQVTLAARIGLLPSAVGETVKNPIAPAALSRLATGVRSRYEAPVWLEISRRMANPIREASRDALVAHLVQREGLRNPDQLFGLLLIDTGINAFVLTSRIRQAIFAVQLYVQRCAMGLVAKNGILPDQIDLREWRVIGRFPIWAARLRTLISPEDLLDPAWRDNKTRSFRDFEDQIRQSDATPTNAAAAYGRYLENLASVAALEVVGTFLQVAFEGAEAGIFRSVLHVVGRSRGGVGRRHFYRRLNTFDGYREWTDWIPVEVDIQGVERDRPGGRKIDDDAALFEPGVHVLPVVWQGELHLFWPTFVRKVDEPSEDDAPEIDSTNPTVKSRFSSPYWEVKLNWTRLAGESFTPKEQSSALGETWWWVPGTAPATSKKKKRTRPRPRRPPPSRAGSRTRSCFQRRPRSCSPPRGRSSRSRRASFSSRPWRVSGSRSSSPNGRRPERSGRASSSPSPAARARWKWAMR